MSLLKESQRRAGLMHIWLEPNQKYLSRSFVEAKPNADLQRRLNSDDSVTQDYAQMTLRSALENWKETHALLDQVDALGMQISQTIRSLDWHQMNLANERAHTLRQLTTSHRNAALADHQQIVQTFNARMEKLSKLINDAREKAIFWTDVNDSEPRIFHKIGRAYPDDPQVWIQNLQEKLDRAYLDFNNTYLSPVYFATR